MTVFEKLMQVKEEKGGVFCLLLDPDRVGRERLIATAEAAASFGVDAILAGSSFVMSHSFDSRMADIKRSTELPVIIFPGGSGQVSKHADAILFMSLISGRNPTYLIEEQVKGAPLIKAYGLEPIPAGYILVESGSVTSVQYISNTTPIPRLKEDIAMAHALAAKYLGMKAVYLEAGSGGARPVSERMIRAVVDYAELPVFVGGGIRQPEEAAARIAAGASFIVIGTRLEFEDDFSYIMEMADAIHSATKAII
jgi:putative glycerol-1-phosphate prenyltransferase